MPNSRNLDPRDGNYEDCRAAENEAKRKQLAADRKAEADAEAAEKEKQKGK